MQIPTRVYLSLNRDDIESGDPKKLYEALKRGMTTLNRYLDDMLLAIGDLTSLEDEDGDTGIEVERTKDEDAIYLKNAGVDTAKLYESGIIDFGKQSGFSAEMSTDQDVANTTWETLKFDTEFYDTQNEFNVTTYTFTAGQEGKYQVSFFVQFLENIADGKIVHVAIFKNDVNYCQTATTTGVAYTLSISGSVSMGLDANDEVELRLYHNHGDARKINGGNCRFSIQKLS